MTALSYSVTQAAKETGLSTSHLDRAIAAGELRVKRTKVNEQGEPVGKRVILARDLQAYLDSLPDG